MDEQKLENAKRGIDYALNLRENNEFSLKTGTARYVVVYSDGGVAKVNYSTCSHGLLHSVPSHNKIDSVVYQLQNSSVSEKIQRRFFEWCLNYSPFETIFVTKDPKEVMENRLVIVDTDNAPSNLFFGGLIAIRTPWENWNGSKIYAYSYVWDRLVELGVHPNLAFSLAHVFRKGDSRIIVARKQPTNTSIRVVDESFNDEPIVRFFLNRPKESEFDKHTYREKRIDGGASKIWGYGSWETPILRSLVNDIRNEIKEGKPTTKKNPFDMPYESTKVESFPYEETLEILAKKAIDLSKDLKWH